MSNVKKGNKFERKALEIINSLKDDGLFGIKEFLTTTPKAKIYSEKRKGNIEFDYIIEFIPPGAERPMMTYYIECKSYKKRVPVIQVQKFLSDIRQVSGINAKGIFISDAPLQKGALNLADTEGMMFIEGESVKNCKIIFHKRPKGSDFVIPFLKQTKDDSLLDGGARSIEKIIDKELLKVFTKSTKKVSFGINKLSKKDINIKAEDELNDLDTSIITKAFGLDSEKICQFLLDKYELVVEYFNPNDNELLGYCRIDDNIIGINKSIVGTKRELFVLCHELGHFLLHQKLYINQQLYDSFSDFQSNLSVSKKSLENPRHWIEWQANYFSISFLVPQSSLMAKLWQSQQRRNLLKGNLYLDDQPDSIRSFYDIISYLSNHFNVSKTSIIYRLKEFDLINDNSKTKRIGELIAEYKSKYFV